VAGSRPRFVNLDGSEPQGLGTVLRWAVVDRVLGRRKPDTAPPRTPHTTPDLELLKEPPHGAEGARLTWLGHARWALM